LLQSVKRQYPGVPIVMITETHNEELAVWAFRARVWNYLVKPVPLRELKANLRQLAKVTLHRAESDSRRVERPGTMLPAMYAPPEPQSEEAVIQRITEHIRRDHTSRLSISKLARGCGMSRFSFSRLFRKNFGVSCRDYVMRLRIETACRLLEGADVSIADVAATAGFTDASYFALVDTNARDAAGNPLAQSKTIPFSTGSGTTSFSIGDFWWILVLIVAAIAGALWIGIPLEAVMLKISDGVSKVAMLTIPFFVLAGAIMAEGGMAKRLVAFANVLVGLVRVRGGLSAVNIIATGRDAPAELVDLADTVTEMRKVKHAFDRGVRAIRGIDF